MMFILGNIDKSSEYFSFILDQLMGPIICCLDFTNCFIAYNISDSSKVRVNLKILSCMVRTGRSTVCSNAAFVFCCFFFIKQL